MTKEKDYYAGDTVLSLVASFIDGSLDFVVRCDLTGMNFLYAEMAAIVLFDHRRQTRVGSKLVGLRSQIWKFKIVRENTFAPHCLHGLFWLKIHSVDCPVSRLERFESFSSTDVVPFEHFNINIKKSYSLTSRRFSKRLHKTAKNICSAVDGVQRRESRVYEGAAGAFVMRERKCAKRGVGCLVRG